MDAQRFDIDSAEQAPDWLKIIQKEPVSKSLSMGLSISCIVLVALSMVSACVSGWPRTGRASYALRDFFGWQREWTLLVYGRVRCAVRC